jgi:hypothetical protein
MFLCKRRTALVGLGMAGLAALAVHKWHAAQERARSLPAVAAVPANFGEVSAAKGVTAGIGSKHPGPGQMLQTAMSRLHAEAVNKFVNTRGFGVGRIGQIGVNQLGQFGGSQIGQLGVGSTALPKEWTIPWWSPGELDQVTPVEGKKDLDQIHQASLKDFNSPAEHSLPAKKKESSPHRGVQSADGDKQKTWRIKTLDLVGLLTHDQPVVYVSENPPAMKDLKDMPTRRLDFFEFAGLEAIHKGEQTFIREKDGTIRMLGAIRAAKECLFCHSDCHEGTLLGAFSYTLRIADSK